jgi:hypothetical protein
MKKFIVLGLLATFFFLVPAVQARDWHRQKGPRVRAHKNYHYKWKHRPAKWGNHNYKHKWNSRRARWGHSKSNYRWKNRPTKGRHHKYHHTRNHRPVKWRQSKHNYQWKNRPAKWGNQKYHDTWKDRPRWNGNTITTNSDGPVAQDVRPATATTPRRDGRTRGRSGD